MSKAFVKDDAPVPEVEPIRTEVLPVTPRGHRALLEARDAAAASGDAHGLRRLEAILSTTEVLAPALDADGGAGFGCRVELADDDGTRRAYELVGPDEVDARLGRISLASPVGGKLRGVRAGDIVTLQLGGATSDWTVVRVAPIA
jgi:transcription elongation factor GreB